MEFCLEKTIQQSLTSFLAFTDSPRITAEAFLEIRSPWDK